MFIALHRKDNGYPLWVRPHLIVDMTETPQGTEVAIDLRSTVRILIVTETVDQIMAKMAG